MKYIGFFFFVFYGRGMFNYMFGFVLYRILVYIVGKKCFWIFIKMLI